MSHDTNHAANASGLRRLSPLSRIDALIENASSYASSDSNDLFNDICRNICAYTSSMDVDSLESPLEMLLHKECPLDFQRFAAVAFWRLLTKNENVFANPQNRARVIDFIIEKLPGEIKKMGGRNINFGNQTFEKLRLLKDLFQEVEKQLQSIADMSLTAENIGTFRQRYLTVMGHNRFVVEKFTEKTNTWLDEIFSVTVDALHSINSLSKDGGQLLKVYDHALETLERRLAEARNQQTIYSTEYIVKVIDRLICLIRQNFKISPISRSGNLLIQSAEKKYPLYVKGAKIRISIVVNNAGPGYTFDTQLTIEETIGVEVATRMLFLGTLQPGLTSLEFDAVVCEPVQEALLQVKVEWRNYDTSSTHADATIEIHGQVSTVPWKELLTEQPYSLEPISTENELVGRRDVLDKLIGQARAKALGSSFIVGQKRVGKTSIVRTLQDQLRNSDLSDYCIIYLEGGDYINPDAAKTIQNLGNNICFAIRASDKRLSHLPLPSIEGALSDIVQFLNLVQDAVPGFRVLIILDEFDELPLNLYAGTEAGHAFFLTMRSISGKSKYAFVLVGGEKMDYILSCQGSALNKFSPFRIDYFNREHFADFQELVRKPILPHLEISDSAIALLFSETAGNPYFAKMICGHLYRLMVERRDCHITSKEVTEALRIALDKTESVSFQHFWDDGIFVGGEQGIATSMERRKVLLAYADALRKYQSVTIDKIREFCNQYKVISTLEEHLQEFVRRDVLTIIDSCYVCKVPFFQNWLRESGVRKIITTFKIKEETLEARRVHEQHYIKPEEIIALSKKWGAIYKGQSISEDRIRMWLSQFDDSFKQRAMFKILQSLRFYKNDVIRAKMKEAHGIVVRGSTWRVLDGKKKRQDILISYLGGPGKSGAQFAKLYADENSIYYLNVIEPIRLAQTLQVRDDVQALVFIDDIIGSGDSACTYIRQIAPEIAELLLQKEIKAFMVAICGFERGRAAIESALADVNMPLQLHICDPIDSSAMCFSKESDIFASAQERDVARAIAIEYGKKLIKNNPLGYGDCQCAIVFEHRCPNNSLPILWAESNEWVPLFKR